MTGLRLVGEAASSTPSEVTETDSDNAILPFRNEAAAPVHSYGTGSLSRSTPPFGALNHILESAEGSRCQKGPKVPMPWKEHGRIGRHRHRSCPVLKSLLVGRLVGPLPLVR